MKQTKRQTQFNNDLDFGKWTESLMVKYIINYFKEKGFMLSYVCDSDFEAINMNEANKKEKLKEFDLKFVLFRSKLDEYGDLVRTHTTPIKYITFEIKADKYSDTGNLAFERKDKNKDSGVFVTKADYFIYFLPRFNTENIYMIKSDSLRILLLQDKWKNYFNYGGDLGKTLNLIIPKSSFNEDFKAAGGKLETFTNYTIPEQYNITKFEKASTTLYKDCLNKGLKQYKNPLDF